ncbi:MAG: hypothetical protein A2V46_10765 [Bacteroidetes bacterium RBG_19FT_COMBO_42_7]|nr:MAG: hypothetical protein A2V46_10765 [Bacteroidetes bacterium RBG_19FT_COMBO_42_7]
MKKLIYMIIILLAAITQNAYSQQIGDLNGIYYQAVAIDEDGKEIIGMDIEGKPLYNKAIGVRFTITKGLDGTIQWEETHTTTTDKYGLFSMIIGQGEQTGSGLYSKLLDIPWIEADQFLKVEISTKNDGNYKLVSNQQFMAVPYSFYTDDIADNAITTGKISDGTIINQDIAGGTIDLTTKVTNILPVANGGSGASSLTNNSLLAGNGTNPVLSLGAATDGQIPIGATGGIPVLANITPGPGITVTNTPGGIEISANVEEVTSDPAGTFVIGNLPVGSTYTSNAINAFEVDFGNIVIGSVDKDLQGCMMTTYVSQPNVIRISIYNCTGGSVNLGTVNVRVFVVK